jgi:arylsulfatase A-like enzyme
MLHSRRRVAPLVLLLLGIILLKQSSLLGDGLLSSAAGAGAAQTSPTGRYAVVIVLDGARPGYFNLAPMPNLQALMHRGVTYQHAFVGQMLANTPPSHATIGTGVLPKHHGIEGFLWEDPSTGQMVDPTQTGNVLHGDLERVISSHHSPTLAGQMKKSYPRSHAVSVSAHKCYASDAMGTASTDYILCALIYHGRWVAQAVGVHRPPPGAINNPRWDVPIPPRTAGFGPAVQQWTVGTENAWTMRYARWAFERVHYPRLMMINLSETDVLGHFTTNPAIIGKLMVQFDAELGRLVGDYRRAGLLDRTDFVITADHGMDRISTTVPYSTLSQSVALAGTSPVYIEHDTAAALGITNNSKALLVAQNVFRLGGPPVDATYYKLKTNQGRWRYRLAASRRGLSARLLNAYVTLANTSAASSGPDVLAIFAPHASSRALVAYGYPWQAGHLGPQWDDQHIPLIIAGPGVRQGLVSAYPARLVDIAPTVERLLGTSSGSVDGVVLDDALLDRTREADAMQAARGHRLGPIVSVLKHRSGY